MTPRLVFAATVLLGLGCASGPRAPDGAACPDTASASTAARRMPVPTHLPLSVRALLSDRMQRHGAAMSDLMWAVVFLDYESAEDIGQDIATEPRLARPLARDATELNALLPAQFFDLQDELAERARVLAEVAAKEDPTALSAAVGRLTDTCLQCHSAYLRDPSQP